MNQRQPFFSVIIPTFNRANLLKLAIKSILEQNFNDYELIVSDNCSTDNTFKVVQNMFDKRIIYRRQIKNVGVMDNIQKAVSYSRGKYIVTMADDDVILFRDTLSMIRKILSKREVGFLRLNFLSKDRKNLNIKNIWINQLEDLKLRKKASNLEIIDFLEKVRISFFTGMVFINEDISGKDFISSEMSPWVKLLFRLVKKYGAYYLNDYFIIASWSSGDISKIYRVDYFGKRKKLNFENYLNFVTKELLDKEGAIIYKRQFFQQMKKSFIYLFPTIKYFTDNINLKQYKERLIKIKREFEGNLSLHFYFYISYFLPKPLLTIVRENINIIRSDSIADIEKIGNIKRVRQRYYQLLNSL